MSHQLGAEPLPFLPFLQGFTSSRQIYTAAINACMISGKQDLQVALDIYSIMQRNGCEPDAILYGNLITLAGKVGVACCLLQHAAYSAMRGASITATGGNTLTCAASVRQQRRQAMLAPALLAWQSQLCPAQIALSWSSPRADPPPC